MNDDMEKSRSENVARLEMKLTHAQSELAKYKAIAEKWEPKCHADVTANDETVRVTMAFGGRRSTASVTFAAMASTDVRTASSAIVDALVASIVSDQLRDIVEAEVQRIQPSLKTVSNAGKW